MTVRLRRGPLCLLLTGLLLAAAAVVVWRSRLALSEPTEITGYALFTVVVGLALFNMRKRLSMLPLGNASTWRTVHISGGLLAIGFYVLHVGELWPLGLYQRTLAGLFYLTAITGMLGYVLEGTLPRRLTQSGVEVIYERIPAELAEIREQAEELLVQCTHQTGSDTLARHYAETLEWYFRRPRFFLSHLVGARRCEQWLRDRLWPVARFLDESERGFLESLIGLAEVKSKIDFSWALQSVLKWWLFLHVPFAAMLLVLAVWHLLLVNVYAL